MVGKVVVVFDRLKAVGFAEKTQMIDRHRFWKQSLKG